MVGSIEQDYEIQPLAAFRNVFRPVVLSKPERFECYAGLPLRLDRMMTKTPPSISAVMNAPIHQKESVGIAVVVEGTIHVPENVPVQSF